MISLKQKELIISNNIKEADLITHSGTFHSDDIFSTVILKNILDKECIKICRINDIEEEIDSIVYDIGGGKYDHHQPGGNGERENGIKYSSFGLIWKDFGKVFLEKIGVENISQVWEKIDKKIVQTIDATDNGQFSIINKFDFEIVTIPNLISVYNSNWDEEEKQDILFLQAVEFAENILIKIIIDEDSKEKAKILIETAIEESENQIIILEKFLPWKECLLQSTNPKAKDILFVIFPSNREGYNICTVPKELGSFESKKLFPIEWKGLRDEELQKITGVNTVFFCHNERFLVRANDFNDIIKMCNIATNEYNKGHK